MERVVRRWWEREDYLDGSCEEIFSDCMKLHGNDVDSIDPQAGISHWFFHIGNQEVQRILERTHRLMAANKQ